MEKKNWFSRHLHWAYVLSYPLGIALSFLSGIIVGVYSGMSGTAVPTDSVLDLIGSLVMLVSVWSVSAWVLHEKHRSLWWVLLAGWLSPLWLSNNSEPVVPVEKE